MEKVVFYKIYKFEDTRTREKFYFEDKSRAEEARFCVYKRYDAERISTNNFTVPVTQVKAVLINEMDLDKFEICRSVENSEQEKEL